MKDLNIINNNNDEEIAEIIAFTINNKLSRGQRVLWFITGGSSIPMQILVSKKIVKIEPNQLVIVLTDERYGEVNHDQSNWFRLMVGGFNVSGAKLIPVLSGKKIEETAKDYNDILKYELENTDYKIGLFGIGQDGHTAGILPNSEAVSSKYLVCSYDAPPFLRITITTKTISVLDEAFAYVFGEPKWKVLESLKNNLSIEAQPAQALKNIPTLTIFSDYKNL